MTSFAFLPRPIQVKSKGGLQKDNSKDEHKFPSGLILKVKVTLADSKEGDCHAIDRTALISFIEQLVPRSCHYVQTGPLEEGKITTYIRSSSSSVTKLLERKLSNLSNDSFSFEELTILTGEEERKHWTKIPLRVKNRTEKQNAALKIKRRRGGRKRKRKQADKQTKVTV